MCYGGGSLYLVDVGRKRSDADRDSESDGGFRFEVSFDSIKFVRSSSLNFGCFPDQVFRYRMIAAKMVESMARLFLHCVTPVLHLYFEISAIETIK